MFGGCVLKHILLLSALTVWAAEPQTSVEDKKVPAEAHAPLFRPKANQAGRLTERVTAELPTPAAAAAKIPHRNY